MIFFTCYDFSQEAHYSTMSEVQKNLQWYKNKRGFNFLRGILNIKIWIRR